MNILNLFKVSLKAVANNKMRSFLSMLGIIIGVAAVIIMMSIGQGSKESIRAELSTMGTNLLTIRPGADMRGGVRQDPSSMQTLKMADYERIIREKRFVTKVSPEVTASGQAIYGNNNTNASMYGESIDYLDIRLWTIEEGECFTEEGCVWWVLPLSRNSLARELTPSARPSVSRAFPCVLSVC